MASRRSGAGPFSSFGVVTTPTSAGGTTPTRTRGRLPRSETTWRGPEASSVDTQVGLLLRRARRLRDSARLRPPLELLRRVGAAVLDDELHGVRVLDLLERVLREHDEVGELAGLDRAEVRVETQRLRGVERRDA